MYTRLFALLLAGAFLQVSGQSTKAELLGVVRDPEGLAVSGARIEILNVSTGLSLIQIAGDEGSYQFLGLPAGEYRLTVSKDKFASLKREGILLRVGDRTALDFNLMLGDARQSVDVNAAAPLLQSNRGTVSFVVEQKKVVTLPLDGRNFVPLIALSPVPGRHQQLFGRVWQIQRRSNHGEPEVGFQYTSWHPL